LLGYRLSPEPRVFTEVNTGGNTEVNTEVFTEVFTEVNTEVFTEVNTEVLVRNESLFERMYFFKAFPALAST
jgi:hypothetical protein